MSAGDPQVPGAIERPADLARRLLASGQLQGRRRRRNQQADQIGNELRRRLLARVEDLDPGPEELSAVLAGIAAELGPPLGPPRAVAAGFLDEWAAAHSTGFVTWLVEEALWHAQAADRNDQHAVRFQGEEHG